MKYLFSIIFFITFFFLAMMSGWTAHVPPNHPDRKTSFALQQDLRIFYAAKPALKLLFEGEMRESLSNGSTNFHPSKNQKFPEIVAFRLGGLYRVHQNLKIGAYYQFLNRRHHHTGDLTSEHIPMLEFIPRFKLGNNFLTEVRIRNELSINQGNDPERDNSLWYTFKIRPKLTYFFIAEAKFTLAIFLAYEHYFPVNYKRGHTEDWIYTGLVIPIMKELTLTPYYSTIFNNSGGDHVAGVTHLFGIGTTFNF